MILKKKNNEKLFNFPLRLKLTNSILLMMISKKRKKLILFLMFEIYRALGKSYYTHAYLWITALPIDVFSRRGFTRTDIFNTYNFSRTPSDRIIWLMCICSTRLDASKVRITTVANFRHGGWINCRWPSLLCCQGTWRG